MKRVIKKYCNPHHWLAFLRRQSAHMQHMYALTIAGVITLLIASAILYIDYGFWRDRYIQEDILIANKAEEEAPESPKEMMTRFFQEAKNQIDTINVSRKELMQGKEIYIEGEE